MDFEALRERFGSPLYLYDFDEIAARYEALKAALAGGRSQIFYAMKANSNLSLLRLLAGLGSGFDCVSLGEVHRALAAGASAYKIILSGVAKRAQDLAGALRLKILYINVESPAELDLLERVAGELRTPARLSIRVNPNILAPTHPYICTGLDENKFGVDMATAKKMYLAAHASPWLSPVGIHFHIGSQLLDPAPILEAASLVAGLARSLLAAGLDLKFFDAGGGLGVDYENKGREPDLAPYARGLREAMRGLDLTLAIEPGRYLVARAGQLLCSVLYEKLTPKKRFIIVDASMSELLRPALYGAHHELELIRANSPSGGEATPADVVGGVCESSDFLAKDRPLPPTRPGDILLIKDVGAYGFSMASSYNARPRPAELAIQGGQARLIRRREDVEDLIRGEEEFLK